MTSKTDTDRLSCHSCGERIPRTATRCPHCGNRSPRSETSVSTSQVDSETERYANPFETTTSEYWYFAIIAGVCLWILALVFIRIIGVPENNLITGLLSIAGWLLIPIGGFYDLKYLRAHSAWTPMKGVWLIGMIIPGIDVLVGLVYLLRRHEKIGIP